MTCRVAIRYREPLNKAEEAKRIAEEKNIGVERQKKKKEIRETKQVELNLGTIFICYAREDSDFALKISKHLRSVGVSIWLDELDIPVGVRWDRAVQKALRDCDLLLVILSPASVESDNVLDEVYYVLRNEKPVRPLLHQKCDIPFRLQRINYVDFTGNYDTDFKELLEKLKRLAESI